MTPQNNIILRNAVKQFHICKIFFYSGKNPEKFLNYKNNILETRVMYTAFCGSGHVWLFMYFDTHVIFFNTYVGLTSSFNYLCR